MQPPWVGCMILCLFILPVYSVIRLDLLKLPYGFTAHVVMRDITGARQMAITATQDFLFVGSSNTIFAISLTRDPNYPDDIIGSHLYTLASNLNYAIGVAYDDLTDTLYYSQLRGVYRMRNVVKELKKPFPVLPLSSQPIYTQFPTLEHHGGKYLGYR